MVQVERDFDDGTEDCMALHAAKSMPLKARRGRPSSRLRPAVLKADQTIARTVWQLLAWGYPLRRRDGVAETVGKLARSVMQRTGHGAKDLGPDQIEKIFKKWLKIERPRYEGGQHLNRPWSRYQVAWLRAVGPLDHPFTDIARTLMQNEGKWPKPEELPGNVCTAGEIGAPLEDPMLTKMAHEDYQRNRLRRAGTP